MKQEETDVEKDEGVTYIQLKFWTEEKKVRRDIQRRHGEDFPELKSGVSVQVSSMHHMWSKMSKLTSMHQDASLWL